MEIVPGTRLSELYGGLAGGTVNCIRHQTIKDVAPGFGVEARCPHDGIVEAMRLNGSQYVAAVQWHPEFHPPGEESVWRADAGGLPARGSCRPQRGVLSDSAACAPAIADRARKSVPKVTTRYERPR